MIISQTKQSDEEHLHEVSKTIKKYPDIGKVIKDFACERRVGEDSWRHTGLLTFSGNTKHGLKLTYRKIKAHLEERYGSKFAYGTVVQLCCVHNNRKLWKNRYSGAAQIVSRKARKGFNVKLNIDAKWSSSMYKILDYIQLKNGLDKVLIQMTLLDSDWTVHLRTSNIPFYKTSLNLSLRHSSKPELMTHPDFVNRYSSTLLVTSYLFMESCNTPAPCVGVVKPQKIIPKNPGQHSTDLKMLGSFAEAKPSMKDEKIGCR